MLTMFGSAHATATERSSASRPDGYLTRSSADSTQNFRLGERVMSSPLASTALAVPSDATLSATSTSESLPRASECTLPIDSASSGRDDHSSKQPSRSCCADAAACVTNALCVGGGGGGGGGPLARIFCT